MSANLGAGSNADKLTLLRQNKWKAECNELTARVADLKFRLSQKEAENERLKAQSLNSPSSQCSLEVCLLLINYLGILHSHDDLSSQPLMSVIVDKAQNMPVEDIRMEPLVDENLNQSHFQETELDRIPSRSPQEKDRETSQCTTTRSSWHLAPNPQ